MAGRILVADDMASNRIVLKAKLTAARHAVVLAPSLEEAPSIAAAGQCDVAIVDIGQPRERALAVCRALKSPTGARAPAVIALAEPGDGAARCAALEAGADDVLSRRVDDALLLARIRGLLRARHREAELGLRDDTRDALGLAEPEATFEHPGHALLVSRNLVDAESWRAAIAPRLRDRLEIVDPDTLLDLVGEGPDVVVVAADDGQRHDGLRLIAELRSRVEARTAGLIAVLAPGDTSGAAAALDLGADDVVFERLDPAELVLRIRAQLRRKARTDRLRRQLSDGLRLALTDPLTGLYNRRYALSHLARIAERSVETGRPFAVMVLDLDRFKQVNDTFGHRAGDAVLAEIARRIAGSLRSVDLVARLGGEEFLVVMPDTGDEAARLAAERLRRLVGASAVPVPGLPEPLTVTVSIGVAIGGPDRPVEELVDAADRALYGSKAEGRNQVTLSRSSA